jgi:large repetitive protein
MIFVTLWSLLLFTAFVGAQSNTTLISNISLADASVLKVPPIVDNTTYTAIFPTYPGTDLKALAPTFLLADGVTAVPESGTTVDLSRPVNYTFSNNGSAAEVWTLSAVHMGSPALPGYYADPNIISFGRKYYIYSTTDGFVGWGGQTFYVWSSDDLVHWNRSAEPILTLNGTSGNVPWADGNAWAPTIVERYGKYFLYFSGNNPTYNRKTIGVAVAPSPEGPFTAQPEPMIINGGNETITTGQAIDPAAFVDPKTGTHYLFWGNGGALQAELADDMIHLKNGTVRKVTGLTNFTEASFAVYREPYYHYTYSNGNTNDATYYVGYATAENVTGPWTYRGVVLHENPVKGILGTGSSSTLNVPGTDDWYMAYHRFGIPGGNGTEREICLDRVHFDNGTGVMDAVYPTLSGILKPEVIH